MEFGHLDGIMVSASEWPVTPSLTLQHAVAPTPANRLACCGASLVGRPTPNDSLTEHVPSHKSSVLPSTRILLAFRPRGARASIGRYPARARTFDRHPSRGAHRLL